MSSPRHLRQHVVIDAPLSSAMIIDVSASQACSTACLTFEQCSNLARGDLPIGARGERQHVLDRQLGDDGFKRRDIPAMSVQDEDPANPWRMADSHTQRTTAAMVAKSSVSVPPSDMWCSDMP